MRKKIDKIVLIASLLLNLMILGLFGRTLYYESKKIAKRILRDHMTEETGYDFTFVDGSEFVAFGKLHTERGFSRLPIKYKNTVRPELWKLSKNSSGISIRFTTNSPSIAIQWELSDYREYANISRINTSGLDLYCFVKGKWQYVNSGIPYYSENEQILISGMESVFKDYMLYFPSYDGIKHIEIGVKNGAEILSPKDNFNTSLPIVFYGTSITQGASASRPGLAYPSIISRNLNMETINLVFSGNGMFEKSIGKILCDIDVAIYVIDCVPNSSPDIIKENALKLVKQLRRCKSSVPILLVESVFSDYSYFQNTGETEYGGRVYIQTQNNELKNVYTKAIESGIDDLYYLSSDDLLGYDHEGTIDGVHPNDLGMMRIADKIESKIRLIFKKEDLKETITKNTTKNN